MESSKVGKVYPKYVFEQKRVLKIIENFNLSEIEQEFNRLSYPFSGDINLSNEVQVDIKTSCGAQ